MEGTTATKRRPRKRTINVVTKAAILLRPDALDELFAAEGIKSYDAKAKSLGYPSTGMLHRAYHGGAVSSALICAVRLRFPAVPYEQLFTEGQVAVNATADLAA